jgi:hypothetical protein
MADHSLGEPIGYRHAVVMYSAETVFGTAVLPATAAGIAKVSYTKHTSNTPFWGPGSADYVAKKGGSTYVSWSLRYDAIQSGIKTLLAKAARVAGIVPPITLGFGYIDDDSPVNKAIDQIPGAKIDTLELNLDASGGHGPLSGSLSGIGFPPTEVTTFTAATDVTDPFYSYEGVLTRAAAAYEVRSWSMTLANSLSRDHVIPGATPSTPRKRSHKYVTEHSRVISGEITRYQAAGVDVQADAISEVASVLTLTSLSAGNPTLVFTFADLSFDDLSVDIDEGGTFFRIPYTASAVAVT